MKKKVIIGCLIAVVALIFYVVPVSATVTTPDSTTLDGVFAYRNIAETGDMGFLIEYHLIYTAGDYPGGSAPVPADLASTNIIIKIMDGSTDLGNATAPYPYYANGYQGGVAWIYYTAAEVTAAGITWEGDYTVYLVGNPLVTWSAGAPSVDMAVSSWDGSATSAATKLSLGNKVLSLGLALTIEWGISLVEPQGGNYYLTTTYGEAYFPYAIQNLRTFAPQIFLAQQEAPIYKTEDPQSAYKDSQDNLLKGTAFDLTDLAWGWGVIKTTYTTGTALFTNGSTAVIGADTVWTSDMEGSRIQLTADGVDYKIDSVTDATHLTLAESYAETGGAGAYTLTIPNPIVLSSFLMFGGVIAFVVGASSKDSKLGRYSVIIALPLILGGARIGGISMTVIAIIGILALFLILYVFFYEKSTQ